MHPQKTLTAEEKTALLHILKTRFEKHPKRHPELLWSDVQTRLEAHPDKLWSLQAMEHTGGEPDVVSIGSPTGELVFLDCAPESPAGRRSVCYDRPALESRKSAAPEHNALDMAAEMGIVLLTEEEYHLLQQFGPFDLKSSSWVLTPPEVRKLGGALYGDCRYGRVFIYHNGAPSYYAARGFRGSLRL